MSSPLLNAADFRDLRHGHPIPALHYCDQPNLLILPDGTWLCLLTTSSGHEGARDQHLRAIRSGDGGLTWSEPVFVEPPAGREASYGTLLAAPSGRIFCFYNFNHDDIRDVPGDCPPHPDGRCRRVDCLGQFVYRWSDDGGRTWSANRVPIPVREFAIDRLNSSRGAIRYFWNPGKPAASGSRALVPLTKVEGFGEPFYRRSEGVILASDDLFSIDDPALAKWQTFPEGEFGAAAPGGDPIAEEHSLCAMSGDSLCATFRTRSGRGAGYYSHDGGTTWTAPEWTTYINGREVKQPQANFPVWPLREGSFLMWFHNEGSRDARKRNPVWLARGWERGGRIVWGEPEIALYDCDPAMRISYPDFAEIGDRWILTETQKTIARWHEVDPAVQQALRGNLPLPVASKLVSNDSFRSGDRGFSVQMKWTPREFTSEEVLLIFEQAGAICGELVICEAHRLEWRWRNGGEPLKIDLNPDGAGRHQLTWIVETIPGLALWVVDGRLNDGGPEALAGWQWHLPARDWTNQPVRLLAANAAVELTSWWNEPLKVASAMAAQRHDPD